MRRHLRAIVYELDPRPVELLTSQLSLWYAFALATSESATRPQPWWLWSAWCATAALAKVVGVLPTLAAPAPRWSPWLRGAGCLLGLTFWIVLSTVFFALAGRGITWGGFACIAAAQGWCLYRIARRGA